MALGDILVTATRREEEGNDKKGKEKSVERSRGLHQH